MGHKDSRGLDLLPACLPRLKTGCGLFCPPHAMPSSQAPYPGSPWSPLHSHSALQQVLTTLPLKCSKPTSSPPSPLHLQRPVHSSFSLSLGPLQLFLPTEQSAAGNLFMPSPGSALSSANPTPLIASRTWPRASPSIPLPWNSCLLLNMFPLAGLVPLPGTQFSLVPTGMLSLHLGFCQKHFLLP